MARWFPWETPQRFVESVSEWLRLGVFQRPLGRWSGFLREEILSARLVGTFRCWLQPHHFWLVSLRPPWTRPPTPGLPTVQSLSGVPEPPRSKGGGPASQPLCFLSSWLSPAAPGFRSPPPNFSLTFRPSCYVSYVWKLVPTHHMPCKECVCVCGLPWECHFCWKVFESCLEFVLD